MELSPPRGFDVSGTLDKLRGVAGSVSAVNVADSPRAQGRMSALAMGSLVQSRLGVEAVMHMAIRHRNLLALHSDLLGAHALGLRNVFTVMGDVPLAGDYPYATAVSDVTASGLIRLMAGFNEGVDANGREIGQPTSFFIGAALNFNALDLDRELRVLERKVEAGAHFLLTQPVYAPEHVERVWSILGGFPLPVIMGVLPLRNARHARFLHNEVPGIDVPEDVMRRIDLAEYRGDAGGKEGIALSRELLTALSGRIAGAYFMPPFERFGVVQETMEGLSLPGLSSAVSSGWYPEPHTWGRSSAGRAPALQAGGQGFESPRLHHPWVLIANRSPNKRSLPVKAPREPAQGQQRLREGTDKSPSSPGGNTPSAQL